MPQLHSCLYPPQAGRAQSFRLDLTESTAFAPVAAAWGSLPSQPHVIALGISSSPSLFFTLTPSNIGSCWSWSKPGETCFASGRS